MICYQERDYGKANYHYYDREKIEKITFKSKKIKTPLKMGLLIQGYLFQLIL